MKTLLKVIGTVLLAIAGGFFLISLIVASVESKAEAKERGRIYFNGQVHYTEYPRSVLVLISPYDSTVLAYYSSLDMCVTIAKTNENLFCISLTPNQTLTKKVK